MYNTSAGRPRIVSDIFICFSLVTVITLMLAGGCSKSPDLSAQTYRTIDDAIVLKLVSSTEAELTDRERGGEDHLICQYVREGTKLRLTIEVFGTKTASYYDIIPDGLRSESGVILYKPDRFEAAVMIAAADKAAAKASSATNTSEREEYYQQAFKLYQKAADAGNLTAMGQLGLDYEAGYGVAKDGQQAVKWYTKAAEQGNDSAQFSLGFMYESGVSVPKDYKKAIKWYTKAASAEKGYFLAFAQRHLSEMYKKGEGVPKDNVQAYKWISLAAAQPGNEDWAKDRDSLKQEMSVQQIDEAEKLAREFKPKK